MLANQSKDNREILVRQRSGEGRVDFEIVRGDETRELWFEWGGDVCPADDTNFMPVAAIGLLHYAMGAGAPLVLDGPLDSDLLDQLQEYVKAWSVLCPEHYRQITVHSTQLTPDPFMPDDHRLASICAFSGGVDSVHTALTETERNATDPSTLAVFVHGMDVDYDSTLGFQNRMAALRRQSDRLGIPLSWARTNLRSDFSVERGLEFAAAAIAPFNLWRNVARSVALGSDDFSGYRLETYPAGSSPVTNPLLGSRYFPVRTIGAELNGRVDKIRVISERPELISDIQACWKARRTGQNCGRCDKCVRTRIALAVAGVHSFPGMQGPTWESIARHKASRPLEIHKFRLLLDEQPNDLSSSERSAVRSMIRRQRIHHILYNRLRPCLPPSIRRLLRRPLFLARAAAGRVGVPL